jgi:S-formylglutathione hydrolase
MTQRFGAVGRRALLAAALSIATTLPAQAPAGRLVHDTVHSAALEHNKYGDSPNRPVLVYLPPSYGSNATKRYPVVYLLHGYSATEASWTGGYSGFDIGRAMDSLVAAGAVNEMIIVMPNARNRFLGSFYTNSESTGNWDDFISRELVAYVDGKYRTLASSRSRGLGGHSMGGYGTFYLAMLHGGDVYGAAYALSGCCTRVATAVTPGAIANWEPIESAASLEETRRFPFLQAVSLALAAAFSPNVNRPPLFVDFPFEMREGQWQAIAGVQGKWMEHAPYNMVPSHADHLKRLAGFAFDVGTRDELVNPIQLAQMDSAFTRAGVPHTFETYDGTHASRIGERMVTKVLPFFSRTLVAR